MEESLLTTESIDNVNLVSDAEGIGCSRNGCMEDEENVYPCQRTDNDSMSTGLDPDDPYEDSTTDSEETRPMDECNLGVDDIQTSISLPTSEPEIGMEFNDEEEAYNFYNMYAKEKGFSVRKGRVERSRSDGRILSRYFVCSNEGKKYTRDKRRRDLDYKPRATKKTDYGAVMRVKHVCGKWVVDIHVPEHNHQLVDPKDAFRLRSHQKATKGTLQLIERLHRCGITPAQIYTVLNDFAGGEQHIGITDVRFKSMIRARRRKSLGVDCQLAVNYLDQKRASDPNFYYTISVNSEQELTGIFWVDGRAREQYRLFGDVVVFDTTYKKNKYRFPFAPFTGVNHHRQCILFGCGLIADETKESFEWLFSTWLQAMHNTHPKSILTDEDPGIMRAIKTVFPTTVHRLCSWHLEKHRMNHLGPLYRKFPEFRHKFYECVNYSDTPIQFKTNWQNLLQMFSLEQHKWLRKKFKLRKHWVPCYFPDTFFAGMTTTQRAESMNNFFKGYFSSSTPINEFITQYEEAIRKRRAIESKEDVKCLSCNAPCSTTHPLERHAAEFYTISVFNLFKEEWKQCLGVEITDCVVDSPSKRYNTRLVDIHGKHLVDLVVDNEEADITTCTCKLFEKTGLLCKHVLKVYVVTDRRRLPERYTLYRWSKAARNTNVDLGSIVRGPIGQPQQPLWMLQDLATRVVSEATLSVERFDVAHKALNRTLEDVLKLRVHDTCNNVGTQESATTQCTGNVTAALDPRTQTITRGRPNHSRVTSVLESVHNRRSYHCSGCGQTGHNVAKCSQVKGTSVGRYHTPSQPPKHIDLNDPPVPDDLA